MNRKFILFLLLAVFTISDGQALVDYSDTEGSSPTPAPKSFSPKKTPVIKRSAPGASGGSSGASYSPSGMFDLGLSYKSIEVKSEDIIGKVAVMEVKGHFATSFNVFVDFNYWSASTNITTLSESSSNQGGNPEFLLGFNWLQFGGAEDGATIDLLAGARFQSSDSDLGSTRTDKIFGVETVKGFYQFALGLGYRLYMTGTPKNEDEIEIGNIQKLYASFGWMISPDIQFEVEGATYKINQSDSTTSTNKLEQKESFGTLSPKLLLGISPMVKFSLGASFRTDKMSDTDKVIQARLWDMGGAYGTSLNAGLNISI